MDASVHHSRTGHQHKRHEAEQKFLLYKKKSPLLCQKISCRGVARIAGGRTSTTRPCFRVCRGCTIKQRRTKARQSGDRNAQNSNRRREKRTGRKCCWITSSQHMIPRTKSGESYNTPTVCGCGDIQLRRAAGLLLLTPPWGSTFDDLTWIRPCSHTNWTIAGDLSGKTTSLARTIIVRSNTNLHQQLYNNFCGLSLGRAFVFDWVDIMLWLHCRLAFVYLHSCEASRVWIKRGKSWCGRLI